jgi:hypothetical protein
MFALAGPPFAQTSGISDVRGAKFDCGAFDKPSEQQYAQAPGYFAERAGSGCVARRRKSPRRVARERISLEGRYSKHSKASSDVSHYFCASKMNATSSERSSTATNDLVPISRIELAPKLISPARRDRKTGAIARHLPSYSLYRWSRESFSTQSFYVLGDIVDYGRDLDCIEFTDNDSDNVSALIEHWPAAITWLDRRGNLEIGVITQARDRRDIADREIPARGEQPDQRVAERSDSLADLYANPQRRGVTGRQVAFQQGEIIGGVRHQYTRRYRRCQSRDQLWVRTVVDDMRVVIT